MYCICVLIGYKDSVAGFYEVYGKLFAAIAAEERKAMGSSGKKERTLASFGGPHADYDTVVKAFYGEWSAFSTSVAFSWEDVYDVRDAPNRQVRRAIEKENKSVRMKHIKERNQTVVSLVTYVKRRDKRVQAHNKKIQQENEMREQQLRIARQQEKERLKELADNVSGFAY